MQGDAELFELAFIPVHQIQDLAAAGLQTGEAELPADPRLGLMYLNPVATFGGCARGFQPCRAGADDEDVPGRGGGCKGFRTPFPLAARRRVDEAGYPEIATAAPPAHLIAGDTGADIAGATFCRFAG